MKRNAKKIDEEKNLTLVDHLSELRKRIIYSGIVLLLSTIVCYNFSGIVVKDIINIVPDVNFVFIAPAELLMSYIKISVIGGLVISAPIIILQIWMYVRPGLKKNEKKTITVSLFTGGLFFILGVAFSYFIVLPIMIKFFMGFKIEEIQEMISFSSYLTFVLNSILAFGVVFELPILMVILTKFHIISVSFLKKNRKYIILTIFVIAAILTPPDVITQTLLALPMVLLFEIGILLSKFADKEKNN